MVKEEDKETQRVHEEGEKAHYLTQNEDWKWAKKKLLQRVSNLDSVKTLKIGKGEDTVLDIKVRKLVIDMVVDWLDDIEGIAQQHREQGPNRRELKKVQEEDYIHDEED